MTTPFANLVIAGVTKAGTTALLHYLAQHPDICGERHKEAQLLVGDRGPAELGTAYAAQFAHCRGERWRVESSPAYFGVGPQVLERIVQPVGELRVLIVLRDPVERVWSAYRMKRSKGLLPEGSFDEFVDNGLHGTWSPEAEQLYQVFDTNLYTPHVRRWADALGAELKVLFFDDLASDTAGTVREIAAWLGLDDSCVDGFDLSVHNRGGLHRSAGLHAAAAGLNKTLSIPLRRIPAVRGALLRAYERANTTAVPEQMSPEAGQRLRAVHDEDARALRRLLADLGHERFPPWLALEPEMIDRP